MADNKTTVVTLSDRQNHMRTAKGLKLVRDLCTQLVGDADSFHGCIWPGNITLNDDKKWTLGPGSDTPVAQRPADEVEFLAPEYFWDGTKSAAADVYSLGLFLYAAYNRGRMPFQAKNKTLSDKDRSDALRRRMKGEPIAVTGSLSAELKELIARALSYDPEKRYISSAELLAALSVVPEAQAVPEQEPAVPIVVDEVGEERSEETVSAEADAPETDSREDLPSESSDEPLPEDASPEETEQEPSEETTEEIAEETLTETPDAAVSETPEEETLTETPDAEPEVTSEPEAAAEPFSAEAKKYTVRKDYEENLVSSHKTAPSTRRRRKRVSPLVPILCILAVGILLVVGLVMALRSVNNDEANVPVIPSDPYIIIPSESENKEDPTQVTAETEEEEANTEEETEEEKPAQAGSSSIDGKIVDPAEGTMYVAESGSKLRTGPSTTYDVADSLARGTALELTGTVGEDWSQVKYNGNEYYISNSLISETDPTGKAQAEEAAASQTTTVASGDGIGTLEITQEANVRSGAGTNYGKVGIAKVGSEYTILDTADGGKWYKIDFGGKTGYINRNMVSVIEMDYSATASVISDVNIRSGPGSSYDKMGVAKAGDSLTVIGTSNGWYKISYDGKTGYVAGNFVTIR